MGNESRNKVDRRYKDVVCQDEPGLAKRITPSLATRDGCIALHVPQTLEGPNQEGRELPFAKTTPERHSQRARLALSCRQRIWVAHRCFQPYVSWLA